MQVCHLTVYLTIRQRAQVVYEQIVRGTVELTIAYRQRGQVVYDCFSVN